MKIESKTEKKMTALEKNINSAGNSSYKSEFSDFDACIKELDEVNQNAENQTQVKTELNEKTKKVDLLKNSKKIPEKNRKSFEFDKSDGINFFIHKNDFLKFDNEIKVNANNLKKEDIVFLRTCLENPSIMLNAQNLQADYAVQNQNGQVSYKSFDVSKGLFNLIENSFKAQKPVRLDFNGNSSVILKMNNDGKLIAEFMSTDKATEYLLKSSISNLKDKLDTKGIPYEEIFYKGNSQNKGKKQKQGENQ